MHLWQKDFLNMIDFKISRREFNKKASILFLGSKLNLNFDSEAFPTVRTPYTDRKFKDAMVEETIVRIKSKCADKELAWLFENCFPNTLDTTVNYALKDGKPDTFVITGDINAMWLRDSTAQVWPYLEISVDSPPLQDLILGVINRQSDCVRIDPYANAFNNGPGKSEWETDHTEMKPYLHERKWEVDSLCYTIRLAYHFWKKTGRLDAFTENWKQSALAIIKTFKEQQRLDNKGPYRFGRTTSWSTDTVPGNGYGNVTKPNGMIHSIFRPSDDATQYPFLIPSNLFAVTSLIQLAEIFTYIYKEELNSKKCTELANEIKIAIQKFGIHKHLQFGEIYAMEVDGFGNALFQDDANVPNLLSLPYLGCLNPNDKIYQNTRKFVLSEFNPYYFKGKVAEGIGSPHTLRDQIWPMSIIMRAMTSKSDEEILKQLRCLKKTHANTGFMHESFDKEDAAKFTRKWFAWANTLFGELILKIERERPHLLQVVL
jgi:meiotically up-regulated gene 157 (Mug157) protein